jgi:hypothetical protein
MSSFLRQSLYGLTVLLLCLSVSSCSDDDPITPPQARPLLSGPAMLDYGTLYAGECQDTTITYNNTATFASTITAIEISGNDVTWVGATLPATVAAGSSLDLSFRACPAMTGDLMSRVVIRSVTDSIVITLRGNVIPVRRTTIGAFYAQPDLTLPVFLKVKDDVLVSGLQYGQYETADAPIGERTIVFQTTSGVELASSQKLDVDSAHSLIAIYSGLGTGNEVIAINTPRGTAPASPLAGVRFIHASKNAPKVKVTLDVAQGPAMTPNFIEYGTSNDAFTQINLNTSALVIVDEEGATLFTLPLSGATALQAGKLYTVVMYGNATPDAPANRLSARIILDPGQ